MALAEKLELLLTADPTQGISALRSFSSETEKTAKTSESSFKRVSAAALKLGVGGVGVGGFLTQIASGDIEAANQLKAAIGQVGQAQSDYQERIDATVKSQVAFGHTDEQVSGALTTLTLAYNDTGKALDQMQLVADLAARKNISLGDAATIVAKAHGGAGRVFKEFGIQVQANADGTKDYDGALTQLAQKLSGQASASADSFGGKLRALKAEAENIVSEFGQNFGPLILGLSTGFTAVAGAATGLSGVFGKLTGAKTLDTVATEAETAALTENAAATEANTAAHLGLASAGEASAAGATLSSGALGSVLAFAAPLAATLPLIVKNIQGQGDSAKEAATETNRYADALKNVNGDVRNNIDLATAQNLAASSNFKTLRDSRVDLVALGIEVQNTTDSFKSFADELSHAAQGTPGFTKAIADARGSTDPFIVSLLKMHDTGQLTDGQLQVIVSTTGALAGELGAAKDKAGDLAAAQQTLGAGASDTAVQLDKVRAAYKDIGDAADKAFTAALKLAPASVRAAQGPLQIADANQKVKDSEEALRVARFTGDPDKIAAAENNLAQARLSVESATIDAASAAADLKETQDAANGVTETAAQKTQNYTNALGFFNAGLIGPTHDALAVLIFDTQVAINKTKELQEQLTSGAKDVTDVEHQAQAPVPAPRQAPGAHPRASGGPGTPGTTYFIEPGTHGEYFTPNVSGQFTPLSKTGSQTVIHQNFYGDTNAYDNQAAAARALRVEALLRVPA